MAIYAREFHYCCGAHTFYINHVNKAIDPSPFTGGANSAQLVSFSDQKVEDSWLETLSKRSFQKHESGAFWFKSHYQDFDLDEYREGRTFWSPTTKPDLKRNPKRLYMFEDTHFWKVSIIYGFTASKTGKLTWDGPYLAWCHRQSLAEQKPQHKHVLLDLAKDQISGHHNDVIEAGFKPFMTYINRNHESENVMYYKENK